ncbi:MAG: site-specific integrase [Alistipes sp.]|nr:site-specific integrase [Alistipes sp.]
MNRHDFNVLFLIIKARLLKNGEAPIVIRLTLGGIRAEAKIKRSIPEKLWDPRLQQSKGKDKQSKELNDYLNDLRLRALTIQKEYQLSGSHYSARLILESLFNLTEQRLFIATFKAEIEKMEQLIGQDYVKITVCRYRNTCKYLQEVILKYYKKDDISFNEINGELVRHFELFLKTKRKCAQNTVVRYMKCFKKIINLALANDWMRKDPFVGIKFKQNEVIKEVLTIDEINRVINKDLKLERLEYVRDVFIFCCFTGLAYTDVDNLRAHHITKDGQGDLWIRKTRDKTKNMCDIPLLPIPQRILEKYRNHPKICGTDKLLPVTSNQKMNSYLKEIADFCEINKKLTTHTARHTYATVVCLNNGVSVENVARMLGHSDIRMTQHYAKVMDNGIKRDMDSLKKLFA